MGGLDAAPPHKPALTFSFSRSFIDFPPPAATVVVGFVPEPPPMDIDHKSSKLALGAGFDAIDETDVVDDTDRGVGRMGAAEKDEAVVVGFMTVGPPKRLVFGC